VAGTGIFGTKYPPKPNYLKSSHSTKRKSHPSYAKGLLFGLYLYDTKNNALKQEPKNGPRLQDTVPYFVGSIVVATVASLQWQYAMESKADGGGSI